MRHREFKSQISPFIIFMASMNDDMFVLSKFSLELALFGPRFDFI